MIKSLNVIRPRDLDQAGIPRVYLYRMAKRGLVRRVGRGLYLPKGIEPTENHSLAEAGKLYPKGVICLLSALQFHNLTTQGPFEVWMAIDEKAKRPKPKHPAIRFLRFSKKSLTEGIEEHKIEGVQVRVYNPAKTVADLFKYRNKVGLDVALEALRDCREQRKCSDDYLWKYAKICRVQNVMRPYLEALG